MRTVDQVVISIRHLFDDAMSLDALDSERQESLKDNLNDLLREFERVKVEYIRDDIISLLNEVS